jgi:hypothetical protein
MENFNKILADYISPNNIIRAEAEKQIQNYLNPAGLDILFNSLSIQTNDQVKLFIAILIKNIFDTKLEENLPAYEEYVKTRKADIVNTILNLKADIKTTKHLVLVLDKCIKTFETNFPASELFDYIFDFYNQNKAAGNVYETFHGLYISFKLLKHYEKEFHNNFFYEKIINDYSEILKLFNENSENEVLVHYINLYLKIFKYSVNFLQAEQRRLIMDLTLQFLYKVLFGQNITLKLFDAIFIANRILIKYTGYCSKIDVNIIKRYTELFYHYVQNVQLYESLINIIRVNYSNINKERKFIVDIIDFFKELLQLSSFDNWGDLILFKECYSDDQMLISDYLVKEFFTDEKLKCLIIFVIKNCLCFNPSEIDLAQSDIEEFYLWYDTLSPIYDLREKAGLLCRIMYDKYKKQLKDFYETLENDLLNLTYNNSDGNLRCGILSFFDSIAFIYFNKHRDYDKWVNNLLLNPLTMQTDIFSKYIILRILMKFIDFKEVVDYRISIFNKVFELFMMKGGEDWLIIKFASIDFLYSYFDDLFATEYPENFIKNYTYQICELFKTASSPDIHNKIIKTTVNILDKFNETDVQYVYPQIFPILNKLWQTGWTFNSKGIITNRQFTSITVIKQNLIKLISIFVKKVGIFIGDNFSYFEFIYNIIGYSISIKSEESNLLIQEALKLILLIQDQFYQLPFIGKNLSNLERPDEFYVFFNYYFKMYDFLPYILENISISDDYFLIQLLIVEQYLSLIFIPQVKLFLDNINFTEKIIYLIKLISSKHGVNFYQPIFNFIEYCLYILNTQEYNLEFKFYVLSLVGDILNQPDIDVQLVYCAIQLINRICYISKIYNDVDINLCLNTIQILSNRYNCEEVSQLHKKIFSNFSFNMLNIFTNCNIPERENILNVIQTLSNTLNEKTNFIDKYNHTLDHWLFFFNKMNTNTYYYNLTSIEEKYKHLWNDRLEKLNYYEVDITDVNFDLKYYSLLNDQMYKIENENNLDN